MADWPKKELHEEIFKFRKCANLPDYFWRMKIPLAQNGL